MSVDESFFVPRKRVSIAAIGDQGEALLLRAILENLGAVVTLHLPGTPEDFLKVIGQEASSPPVLIVSGHGDEDGLIFGAYAPEIDVSMLTDGHLGAEAIAARADMRGAIVISTACGTGGPDFASAFLGGGASAYVAPEGYPEGADAALFMHRLMHGLLQSEMSLAEALEGAQSGLGADSRFKLYRAEPESRR